MKLRLEEIVKDEEIYPRIKENTKVIDEYVEALEVGTKFPSITVQKVKEKKEDKEVEFYALIDGLHRKTAIKVYNKEVREAKILIEKLDEIKEDDKKNRIQELSELPLIEEIECEEPNPDKIFDKNIPDDLIELKKLSIKANLLHGLKIDRDSLKEQIREIYALNEKGFKQRELAKEFNIHQTTVGEYIRGLKYKYELSRDALILKLHLLGWSGEEIGMLVGLSGEGIRLIKTSFKENLISCINSYQKGKSIEKIASDNGFNIPLAYAVVLNEEDDKKRVEEFSKKQVEESSKNKSPILKLYDVWNFSERDERLGIIEDSNGNEIKGIIPGQIPLNVLYYYSKPGDLVVEPMAGGGSTIDACLVMGRKCLAFDKESKRPDIKSRDTIEEGIEMPKKSGPGEEKTKADLVFVDPPYWNMKDDDYPDGSISSLSRSEFYESLQKLARNVSDILKKDGFFAIILQNQTEKDLDEGEEQIPHVLNVYNKVKELDKFELVRQISCPQSSQTFLPQQVEKAKKEGRMLGLVRDLLIWRKK